MVAGRVQAAPAGPSLTAGVWLGEVPLDSLGKGASALAAAPGVAGAVCAPARAERDAARESALRAVCAAFGDRPVAAAPRRPEDAEGFLGRVGRPNLLLRLGVRGDAPAAVRRHAAAGRALLVSGVHAPARLDALVEAWLSGLEERAAAGGPLPGALFGVDAVRLTGVYDSIAHARMDSAPTDFIRAAYRLLVGRVGWAVAAVCRRRLSAALNGARFAALAAKGAPRPLLLVSAPADRLGEFAAPETAWAVPFAAAGAVPAPVPGRALEEGYDEAKRLVDKLANYQIDLDAVAGELQEAP